MKKILLIYLFLSIGMVTLAQSKVFREVSEEVSSEMKIITQGNALVGYLVFTQLEKATEDSFNYRITLMDENLNDIGKVEFREENLNLEAVSFEEDILCLAYLKSNVMGKEFKNAKEYDRFEKKNSIFTQFITLTGKIIKSNTERVILWALDYESGAVRPNQKYTYLGRLIHGIQLQNMSGKGFTCFFGDRYDRKIISYDLAGNVLWEKNIGMGVGFGLLTFKKEVYLLEKIITHASEEKFYIIGFDGTNGKEYYEIRLADSNWNNLTVKAWGNDPVTGIPYVSGNIENSNKMVGLFTMDLAGPDRKEVKKRFIYWDNGSKKKSGASANDYSTELYMHVERSFRDFKGNTWFLGNNKRSKSQDVALFVLNPAGGLSHDNTIDVSTKNGEYYGIENPATKENYIIIEDAKDILIYSLKKKKVVRTVPEKEGKIRTKIFPAKEGHVMIVERNKKEKYTRLSIEPLN